MAGVVINLIWREMSSKEQISGQVWELEGLEVAISVCRE
jgi:hypothetical protein